jgi:hypothetical protein
MPPNHRVNQTADKLRRLQRTLRPAAGYPERSLENMMKRDPQFYRDIQRYLAITAIGPSALRNQGSGGVIKAARNYLAAIDLGAFRTKNQQAFLNVLDGATEALKRAFPKGHGTGVPHARHVTCSSGTSVTTGFFAIDTDLKKQKNGWRFLLTDL